MCSCLRLMVISGSLHTWQTDRIAQPTLEAHLRARQIRERGGVWTERETDIDRHRKTQSDSNRQTGTGTDRQKQPQKYIVRLKQTDKQGQTQRDTVNHRQTQRKTPCSSCKGLGTQVTGVFLFSFGIMNFKMIILTCFAIWGFDINLNLNQWQFFLSINKLGNINYLKGLTDSNKKEIPFPNEKQCQFWCQKPCKIMNQLQWWKYIKRNFLGPNRSPWTISCILRLYQNHRATQTMPPKLDRYSLVSHWSDWTPCIHWSWKSDRRNISGAAGFLRWTLYWTDLIIAFFVHHTLVPRHLESIFADKKSHKLLT